MLMLLSIYGTELIAALPVVPAIIIYEKVILKNKSASRIFCEIIFTLYLSAVFIIIGLPSIKYITIDPTLNIIPFVDIVNYPLGYIRNSLLNVLLFVPLGIFLPLIWPKLSGLKKVFVFGFFFSFFIEFMQLFTVRVTDIDDIIFNTLGCILGFLLYRFIFFKPHFLKIKGREEGISKAAVPFIISFIVMFFIQPYISTILYSL